MALTEDERELVSFALDRLGCDNCDMSDKCEGYLTPGDMCTNVEKKLKEMSVL